MINITGKFESGRVWINGRELKPDASQKIYNHSPDGFSWGYAGSGPAQLALAILYELTDDADFAIRYHQYFKNEWVEKLPKGDFSGWSKADEWIKERGGKVRNSYKIQVAT